MFLLVNTIFLGLLRTVNRFCSFVVKRQRLKAIESRKKMGPYWCRYFQCKRKECSVKVKLILHSQFSDNNDMEFQGNIYHNVRKTYADDIRGIDREELKDDFKNNLFTPPTQVYGERLNNISDEVFASGNRENASKSPKVIQQLKSEVTSLHRKKNKIHQFIIDVADQILLKDKADATKRKEKRKIWGYVQNLSVFPCLKIVFFH